jgi:hypothetical protein
MLAVYLIPNHGERSRWSFINGSFLRENPIEGTATRASIRQIARIPVTR